MTFRAVLVIALASFFCTGLIRADNPKLPSRKASVVVPLLKQFSPEDTYGTIEKILGKPDADVGSGIYIYLFRLDDSTSITVGTTDRRSVYHIQRTGRGIKGTQILFLTKEGL